MKLLVDPATREVLGELRVGYPPPGHDVVEIVNSDEARAWLAQPGRKRLHEDGRREHLPPSPPAPDPREVERAALIEVMHDASRPLAERFDAAAALVGPKERGKP